MRLRLQRPTPAHPARQRAALAARLRRVRSGSHDGGEVYADFVLLWLLCHESRVETERPEDCWLEQWLQVAIEQGTRVRKDLGAAYDVLAPLRGAGR